MTTLIEEAMTSRNRDQNNENVGAFRGKQGG